jgi:hypothetical protein
MNVSFTLTLDGLVRALRGEAHALADEAETRYSLERGTSAARPAISEAIAQATDDRERSDDRSGR